MEPLNLVDAGVGLDAALKVHVVTLLDVLHIQTRARRQEESRKVWGHAGLSQQLETVCLVRAVEYCLMISRSLLDLQTLWCSV